MAHYYIFSGRRDYEPRLVCGHLSFQFHRDHNRVGNKHARITNLLTTLIKQDEQKVDILILMKRIILAEKGELKWQHPFFGYRAG